MKKTHFKPLLLIFDVHASIWFTCDNGSSYLKEETLGDTGVSQWAAQESRMINLWN
jgi:flavorubredoxin